MTEAGWTLVRDERAVGQEATEELGAWFAARIAEGDAVALEGPLGAGKTTFVRGLVRALGYRGRVRSPSFTLIHRYPTEPVVQHADLYRLNDASELIALDLEGGREEGVLFVEWADRLADQWGEATWRIRIAILEDGAARRVRIYRREEDAVA